MPSTCGTNAASHATRRNTSGDNKTPVAVDPITSPAPVNSCKSVRLIVTCKAAELPAAPSEPCPAASSADERRHTSASASTRRCPAGRRSRCPVSSFGAGADNGPIAASNTAACSAVTTSWYSVTSPDATHGCDNRATEASRSCNWSSSPARPYLAIIAGRSLRI